MTCPKCKAALNPITYKGITIDKCPQCEGVWLDKGEENFVTEVLRHAGGSFCAECEFYLQEIKKCNRLKIFVSDDFSCGNFLKR
ncbi:MAG: zf-TFIIB domain-containing protein [Spirochaetia bacterium]|nr:zf-TFIIB domain-containing protein [Spirochaetia bacterium]